MAVKTIRDVDIADKRVLIRVDFNVPLTEKGLVSDETRINAHLDTIRYALDQRARVILMSHLGRPNGQFNEKFSLKPIGELLRQKLSVPVKMAKDCVGSAVKENVSYQPPGTIVLLENLRFHEEEENNDDVFAKTLASFADVYINDAFGTAHRKHASTYGVANFVKASACGLLMARELEHVSKILGEPERPFAAIIGGGKVSSKLKVLRTLLGRVDHMILGGAMAYTFMKSQGVDVGGSRVEEDLIPEAETVLKDAQAAGTTVHLPMDHVVAHELRPTPFPQNSDDASILSDMMGVDIGEKTVAAIEEVLQGVKTIFWNGPMGVFEVPGFERGTMAVAKILAASKATTIVGGGDSVAALNQSGLSKRITHVSTGGGALLEYIENGSLPGVDVLDKAS